MRGALKGSQRAPNAAMTRIRPYWRQLPGLPQDQRAAFNLSDRATTAGGRPDDYSSAIDCVLALQRSSLIAQ